MAHTLRLTTTLKLKSTETLIMLSQHAYRYIREPPETIKLHLRQYNIIRAVQQLGLE
jgi:hypothetical protein